VALGMTLSSGSAFSHLQLSQAWGLASSTLLPTFAAKQKPQCAGNGTRHAAVDWARRKGEGCGRHRLLRRTGKTPRWPDGTKDGRKAAGPPAVRWKATSLEGGNAQEEGANPDGAFKAAPLDEAPSQVGSGTMWTPRTPRLRPAAPSSEQKLCWTLATAGFLGQGRSFCLRPYRNQARC